MGILGTYMYLTLLFRFCIVVPYYFFEENLVPVDAFPYGSSANVPFYSCVPLLLTQLLLIQIVTLLTYRSSTIPADSEDLVFSKLLGLFEHDRAGKSNNKQVAASSNMHNAILILLGCYFNYRLSSTSEDALIFV